MSIWFICQAADCSEQEGGGEKVVLYILLITLLLTFSVRAIDLYTTSKRNNKFISWAVTANSRCSSSSKRWLCVCYHYNFPSVWLQICSFALRHLLAWAKKREVSLNKHYADSPPLIRQILSLSDLVQRSASEYVFHPQIMPAKKNMDMFV